MMRNPIPIIGLFLLTSTPTLPAQTQSDEIDPVVASPDLYQVVLENQQVRVVEYAILPGQKDNWHTHPAKVSHIISGGSLKITPEDGEPFVVREETGATTWFEAVGKHYGENVGSTPVRIVFVEIKQAESSRKDVTAYKRD
jgi:quercetin dioxygenase-like cupin family protein